MLECTLNIFPNILLLKCSYETYPPPSTSILCRPFSVHNKSRVLPLFLSPKFDTLRALPRLESRLRAPQESYFQRGQTEKKQIWVDGWERTVRKLISSELAKSCKSDVLPFLPHLFSPTAIFECGATHVLSPENGRTGKNFVTFPPPRVRVQLYSTYLHISLSVCWVTT